MLLPESEYRDAASSSVLQIGGSIAGGDGHSSLCLGLVVAVGVDARLERDPERLLPRGWGKV